MTSPSPLPLRPHTFHRKVRQRRKIKDDVRRNQKHTPPALPAAPGINLQIARDACKTHTQIHTRNHAETPIHTEYVCIDRHTHTHTQTQDCQDLAKMLGLGIGDLHMVHARAQHQIPE